jgi:hypothetical protein
MPDQTWVFTLSILRGHGKEGRQEVREQLETFLHSFIGGSDSTPANNQGTKSKRIKSLQEELGSKRRRYFTWQVRKKKNNNNNITGADFL